MDFSFTFISYWIRAWMHNLCKRNSKEINFFTLAFAWIDTFCAAIDAGQQRNTSLERLLGFIDERSNYERFNWGKCGQEKIDNGKISCFPIGISCAWRQNIEKSFHKGTSFFIDMIWLLLCVCGPATPQHKSCWLFSHTK